MPQKEFGWYQVGGILAMRKSFFKVIFWTFLCDAMLGAQARPWVEIRAPHSVEIKQEIADPTPGWEACTGKKTHVLTDVTIYDGRPEQLASLEPDEDQLDKQNKIGKSYYRLSPAIVDGHWIACSYFATNVQLCMRIPDKIQEICITYSVKIPNNVKIIKIEGR